MSLKQLITEGIGKPVLYHFCTFDSLKFVLKYNKIKPLMYAHVSFTRKFDAHIVSRFDNFIRLTVDWNRLKSFYSIESYRYQGENFKKLPRDYSKIEPSMKRTLANYRDGVAEEREERIEGEVTRLDRFLLQIDVMYKDLSEYQQHYIDYVIKEIEQGTKLEPFSHVKVNKVNKWEPVKI